MPPPFLHFLFIYVRECVARAASNNHLGRYHENESRIDCEAKSEASL